MPLQKSFSDQNHSIKKFRPQWGRNQSYSGPRRDDSKPLKTSERSPAVPISSVTKDKLNVFQFGGAQSAERQGYTIANELDNKENHAEGRELLITKPSKDTPQKEISSPGKNMQHSVVPTTPAGRLALPDLIGMIDFHTEEIQISPDERVTWHHEIETTSSASSYVAARRRKRARSSSPIGSSPAHISSHIIKTEPFDFRRLSQTLKTPQAEPGSELWERYGGNNSMLQGASNSKLAHLLYTSSPQSSRQASATRADSKLRRSMTCGTQWPKRRRVAGGENVLSEDVFVETKRTGLSNLSRANALLVKISEGRQVSQDSDCSARSCSPSSQGLESRILNPGINSKAVDIAAGDDISSAAIQAAAAKDGKIQEQREDKHVDADLDSDYGDIDEDELGDIAMDAMSANDGREDVSEVAVAPSAHRGGVRDTAEDKDDDDDFGYMDEEELEDIVAKYDDKRKAETIDEIMKHEEHKSSGQGEVRKVDSEDEYGDDLDDLDYEAVESAATQCLHQSATGMHPPLEKVRAIQRYLVTSIVDTEYDDTRGRPRQQKVLFVAVDRKKQVGKSIFLRGGWLDTPVTQNAYVHVIGNFSKEHIIIDDDQHMLILHPDHLISSTVVADSFGCTRRAVLQDRVKATSSANPSLVYGTILHEIFQAAMLANRWDTAWLSETINSIASRHLEDLYKIQLQIPQAVEHLKSKMNELQSWAELFVSSSPKQAAILKATNSSSKATMCVSKLLDVEEHVWSPMYGLKGNIDATVQVTIQEGEKLQTLTVPFEVKTGKHANAAHRAQTALYNLLLSDRYDVEIAYGILYYMETSETIRIPSVRHEIRHMIMKRNELACFVRERHAQLPPMLKNPNVCNGCYAKVPCFIYHRLADEGDGESSGVKSKFDEVVKHLTPKHKDFFLKWDDLLTKEEKESLRFRRELWTMLSAEREKLGRCFSNVIIEPGSAYEEQDNPKINRYKYTMIKPTTSAAFSFHDSQMVVGEPVVISDEQGHFALANGYVTHVKKTRITVAVDRRLHNARVRRPAFNEKNNQVFASIMEVAGEGEVVEPASTKIVEDPVLYRLDKDEFSNGMATVRNNLVQVMAEGPFGSREIRSLVVDLVEPRFKPNSTNYVLTDRENINIDQRRAIAKVMSAQDYALVLGMPGTGKTTTIAHIIRALVSQGKSVLLTSYTHTAVDNILLKLKNDDIPVLRLGTIAKIHPDVQNFANLAAKSKASFEEIRSAWHESPIVATTCLGVNHAVFSERTFDYCIVDEASQITLPVCLGPIRMARTFILVGDHNQLPPLVQNEEARTGGLDISLFKLLSDVHPSSVVNLEHQYRMCEDVMVLSNSLIYSGRLKCGNQEVANRSITIPNIRALSQFHFSPATLSRSQKNICQGPTPGHCWIRELVDPASKVRFINTDTLLPLAREESKGNRIVNHTEARIVTQLVEALIAIGIPAASIGVMTHYRSQLALLKDSLRQHKEVEMHTADRFQGRDKEVILLSLVRSNETQSIGELLKDWRRINVAFTRAKTKLLVVGSKETLKGNNSEEMVSKVVKLMEEKKWIFDLPRDALEMHIFEDGPTQFSNGASGISQRNPGGTQWKPIYTENKKTSTIKPQDVEEKENMKPFSRSTAPRKAGIGAKGLMSGRPVMRDIYNDLLGSGGPV